MKRFIDTLRNIWTIEELRQRIIVTLGLVLIYRLGSYVVLPGVNVDALNSANNSNDTGGIVGLINMFAGGAFLRASIFGLGIMPYISSSIIVQLLTGVSDYFKNLKNNETIIEITIQVTIGK